MRSTAFILSILCLVSAIGCSGSKVDGGPVAGKVTLDGKPLTGVDIKFHNPDLGVGVNCTIGEDGTFASETSIPAATYQIAISPTLSGHEPGSTGMPTIPKLPAGLPKKYSDPEKSGVTAEVKTQPQNDFEFDLKSK